MRYFMAKNRYLESTEVFEKQLDDKKALPSAALQDNLSIASEAEFFVRKANENERRDKSFKDELINFDDGTELTEVTRSYKGLIHSLIDFKEQKQTLDSLNVDDDIQKEHMM